MRGFAALVYYVSEYIEETSAVARRAQRRRRPPSRRRPPAAHSDSQATAEPAECIHRGSRAHERKRRVQQRRLPGQGTLPPPVPPTVTPALTRSAQARLVESGAKKLIQLYTMLVAEGSSGVPPGGSEFSSVPFPPQLLATLRPLVAFLRTLPLPATHPSHPAASGIQSALKDAQKGYGDMRGAWVFGKRVVDRAETIDSVSAARRSASGRGTS